MSRNATKPGLTAAMTAGRALLAAGWRYDSTSPMADDTTIRTLLHPTGREIHARTVDGGEQTDLTMTGLTLEQVAGAIDGAGLGLPAQTEPSSDLRQVAWQLVINGVGGGLPIPAAIDIPGHYHIFSVRLPDSDRGGVDAWAAYLSLPAPALEKPLGSGVQNYRSLSWDHPALPGWKVEVSAFCVKGGAQ